MAGGPLRRWIAAATPTYVKREPDGRCPGAVRSLIPVTGSPYSRAMEQVEIDESTKWWIDRLATSSGQSAARVVELAVRGLVQEQMGKDLANPLTDEDIEWLDADLGPFDD